jgi:hypothetical protein
MQHSEDVMTVRSLPFSSRLGVTIRQLLAQVRYACGGLRNLSVDATGRLAIGAVHGAVSSTHETSLLINCIAMISASFCTKCLTSRHLDAMTD